MSTLALSDADRKWFLDLRASVYEIKQRTEHYNMSCTSKTYDYESPRRRLTRDEWDRLCQLVTEHELPVSLFNANMGFGIGMAVYDHAPFPGTKPDHLMWLTGQELPRYRKDRDANGFVIGWDTFSPIAKMPRNAELLAYYGMEPIKSRSHYDYRELRTEIL